MIRCFLGTICRNDMMFRIRRKAPKYTLVQFQWIPGHCCALRRMRFVHRLIVVDDKKYFTLSHLEILHFIQLTENTPENIKLKGKCKNEDKILLWCAISKARVVLTTIRWLCSRKTLFKELCIQRCLSKLFQFLSAHHVNGDIMFWPDLA